jgi:hypothetical protein
MTQTLGWFGSALIVASLVTRQPIRFRLLNLASAVVLLAFNLAIELWSMVALNIVILAVNVWQLRTLWRAARARNRPSLTGSESTAAPEAARPGRSTAAVTTPAGLFTGDAVRGAILWVPCGPTCVVVARSPGVHGKPRMSASTSSGTPAGFTVASSDRSHTV